MRTTPLRTGCVGALALVGGLVVAFVLARGPIDPASYDPPQPPPMAGALAPNELLREAQRIADGKVAGPEDVAVDGEGRIYAGLADGRIVRVTLGEDGGESLETFASTGGRPLGLHFDAAGHLVVADAVKGLLRVAPDGSVTPLATKAEGLDFRFTDDVDVASDGSIYFSDASWRFGHESYLYDLLEARPYGRLLRWDPATGTTEVLLRDLYFANGVALSADESFVLVNETYRYRITRYWLEGERAGTSDVFIDNLPGFPDGVSGNRRGTFWVALFTVRNPVVDRLHPSVFAKRQLAKLPRFLWPRPEPYGLVVGLDETGRVVRSFHDPTGERVSQVTSAEEVGSFLYLGNLALDYMSRIRL